MSEEKTEYQFDLENPITYSTGGDQREASFIVLKAPSPKVSRECAALKQAFFRAVPRDQEGGSEEGADPSGQDVITIMAMSKDVDLPEVLEVGRKLFTSGNSIALVEGEEKLTNSLIDRMSQDDFERMLGEYMVTFTLASALAKTKKL